MSDEVGKGRVSFLEVQPPDPPKLMNNVVNVFSHGIPNDCYDQCVVGSVDIYALSPRQQRQQLADFVRTRLNELALFEYGHWINGRIPFVTPRELQLWRLRQFVQYLWFWNLPDDENLALIFNLTLRKAANLATDFLARFRKTILYPVAIRRLYELLQSEPLKASEKHPRKAWEGCIYRLEFRRYLEHLNSLIAEFAEHTEQVLIDAYWYDRDEGLIWLPTEVRDIAVKDSALREELFDTYPLP